MSEIAIAAQELGKTFGSFTAVHAISLQVPEASLVALLGPNGAGKTTTVRMLASILRPTRGHAMINGLDSVVDAERVRGMVGLLTEQPGLYGRMNALDYLNFFGELHRVPQAERKTRINDLLERFSLGEHRSRPIGTFSKGMRQKIALCRAVIHDPLIVFLDEPTSGLDPAGAKAVRDFMAELKARKRTVIVCTHNLSEVEALAEYIAIIKQGSIIAEGTAESLKRSLLGPPLYELRLTQPLTTGWAALSHIPPFTPQSGNTLHSSGDTWLRYSTTTPELTNPLLLRAIHDQNASVLSLAELPRSLESVYLNIINATTSTATKSTTTHTNAANTTANT